MSGTESPVTNPNLRDHMNSAFHHKAIYQPRYSYPLQECQSTSTSSPSINALHHSNNLFSPQHETWPSNISYTTTTDVPPSDLAFCTHDTTAPAVPATWSPQNVLDTTAWNYTPGLEPFTNTTDLSNYTQWRTVEQSSENLWPSSSLLPTQPLQSTTMPIQVPYRYESFFAYKRPDATQSQPFTEMGITAEMTYPAVYPTAAQILETSIHPTFDNVEAVATSIPDIADPVILNSAAAKQAISVVNPKAQQVRSDPCSHASPHSAVAKTKSAPKGGRVGPLTLSQREKVEDMRNYGACWRCRKYKKPVCLCPQACFTN